MIYTQKSPLFTVTFAFEDAHLVYTMTREGRKTGHNIPYDSISFTPPNMLRKHGFALGMIGLLLLAYPMYLGLAALLAEWLQKGWINQHGWLFLAIFTFLYAILLFCARKELYLNETYSLYDTAQMTLYVRHDAQTDNILSEITNRRKAKLRADHGTLNLLGDPSAELARFKTLKEWHVIDDAEFQTAFEKIKVRIREYNLKVDPNAFPDDEIRKFTWMLDNGIISESEYQDALKILKANAHSFSALTESEIVKNVLH